MAALSSRCGLSTQRARSNVRPCTSASQLPTVFITKLNSVAPLQRTESTLRLPSRAPLVGKRRVAAAVVCQAAAASGDAPVPKETNKLTETLILGALFGAWYLANIYFNIYNKQVLKAFPHPVTCTTLQFAVGGVWSLVMWAVGLHKAPAISMEQVKGVSPLAVVHTMGNALTNVSLGTVAVSFTHTIKALEPFFSVLLSTIFLNDPPSGFVLLTLLPIVGGVAMASASEASFNWLGFGTAMGSNLTFQSRNVLSKVLMNKDTKGGLDNINLFSIITILSFFLLAPVALAVDGVKFTPAAMQAMGIAQPAVIIKKTLLAGVFFHMYQQVSYMILQRVSPVTHSIGNCVKRVIVIIASVVVFQNPMSQQNMMGTALALFGVFAYSQAKRMSNKKAKAA